MKEPDYPFPVRLNTEPRRIRTELLTQSEGGDSKEIVYFACGALCSMAFLALSYVLRWVLAAAAG